MIPKFCILSIVVGFGLSSTIPQSQMQEERMEDVSTSPSVEQHHVCQPNPCGSFSQCREYNNQAVCSCLPEYIGRPPTCHPECVLNVDCPSNEACSNQMCIDPCADSCGLNAECKVVNHNPICSCLPRYTGNAFVNCSLIDGRVHPCSSSPCGANSECRADNDHNDESYTCNCLQDFFGSPPNCRPECVSNSDCDSQSACINHLCKNACNNVCDQNAECHVDNHIPICKCHSGFNGDSHNRCNLIPSQQVKKCVVSSECSTDTFCINQKCVNPCSIDVCGPNAECQVNNNRYPECKCRNGFTGNPFSACRPISLEQVEDSPDSVEAIENLEIYERPVEF